MEGLTDGWTFYLVMGFPAALILFSGKTRGGEKISWFIAVCLFSWIAWLLYVLLAPHKLKNNCHEGLIGVSVIVGIAASIVIAIVFLDSIKFNGLESLGALFVLPVVTLLVALVVYVITYIVFGAALKVPANRIIELIASKTKLRATRLNMALTVCLLVLVIITIVTKFT